MNSRTDEGGSSARLYDGGYWGFASAPGADESERRRRSATRPCDNAQAMARFGAARALSTLPGGSYRGEHVFAGRPPLSQKRVPRAPGRSARLVRGALPGP